MASVTAAAISARGTTRKGQRTRARIIEGGREVLQERGYFDAHVTEITERSGVALGTFYRYFPNKDALFLLLLETVTEELHLATGGSWDAADVRTSLRTTTERYLQAYYGNRRLIAALLQMSAVVPEGARLWTQLRQRQHARMQRYLEQATPAHQLSPELISSALALMVERAANYWFIELPSSGERGPDVTEAAEVLSALWYRSVYEGGS